VDEGKLKRRKTYEDGQERETRKCTVVVKTMKVMNQGGYAAYWKWEGKEEGNGIEG
jgi:hypothetical protein